MKTDALGHKYVPIKDGEYALTYNRLSGRYCPHQYLAHYPKVILTDNEEFVDIFTSSERMYEVMRNLESLHQVMDS